MKRTTAFLMALLLLILCMPVFGAAAYEEKTFRVTHFNNNTIEGAATIFTKTYTGAAWWIHVAFEPVEGAENTYKIVDVSDGTGQGNAIPLNIPEGGFVWAANYGNNYSANGGINYTNDAINEAIAIAKTWTIGNIIVIDGLDLEGMVVPTTTAGTLWYDESYVCTSTFHDYEGATPGLEDEPEEESDNSAESDKSKPITVDDLSDEEDEGPKEESYATVIIWIIAGVVLVGVIGTVIIVAKKK